ncbi:hypothetical protein GCM10011494_02770 [Novosphingobium endophyticum]|uniref:Uncharacterized protein n=1 Tax=Novosphingobium endophyticum TaxID=1955250 RepID=A0A916TP59_9SPHN|nr:hypothetical protein [Novosphingobium endophyticum]GGB87874.1 hypothetical protein GCM10011494_02770 [Novosphingobium endophyticum]
MSWLSDIMHRRRRQQADPSSESQSVAPAKTSTNGGPSRWARMIARSEIVRESYSRDTMKDDI